MGHTQTHARTRARPLITYSFFWYTHSVLIAVIQAHVKRTPRFSFFFVVVALHHISPHQTHWRVTIIRREKENMLCYAFLRECKEKQNSNRNRCKKCVHLVRRCAPERENEMRFGTKLLLSNVWQCISPLEAATDVAVAQEMKNSNHPNVGRDGQRSFVSHRER